MIRQLEPADRPRVERLLAENPHKTDQIRVQQLDPVKLLRFHSDRLMSRVGDADRPVFILEESGAVGLMGFEESKAHSLFFEKLAFSLTPVLSYNIEAERKAALLRRALETARNRGARVAWIQVAEEESDWFPILVGEGGAYCGTSLRLTRRLAQPEAAGAVSGAVVRSADEKDLPVLESIAERGHGHSHFFRDPHLPEDRKKRLFPEYLRKSFGQSRRMLWVAESDSGEPVGFALLIVPQGQEETLGRRVGVLDFIVVDPGAQGRGIGKLLLDASHRLLAEKGCEFVELKTQLDNRPAVNFYRNEGYRLVSSEVQFSLG